MKKGNFLRSEAKAKRGAGKDSADTYSTQAEAPSAPHSVGPGA